MSDDDARDDLAERARFLARLTDIGVPWPPAGSHEAEVPEPGGTGPGAGAPGADPEARLRAIREEMGDCQRCGLAAGRKKIVFGQGTPRAELMFVGEAPGADEDEQGLAFVGRAGKLLTDIIEKGLRMKREDVFIGNVVKCRPPQNRNPEADEIMACQPFLEAQIRAIQPKVLVALGKFSAHWLLKTAVPITRLRGQIGEWEGIPAMPTYHPAYLLRNPAGKRPVWEDMQEVLRKLGREAPPAKKG